MNSAKISLNPLIIILGIFLVSADFFYLNLEVSLKPTFLKIGEKENDLFGCCSNNLVT